MTEAQLAELFARRVTRLESPPRPADYLPAPPHLNPQLVRALGIRDFYRHQAESFQAALAGKDLVVTTGTGSGKSLCAVVPMLHQMLTEPSARAFMVFPTKALAQDQATKLEALAHPLGLRVATYDGDTPQSQRSGIRKAAHIVVTNPDMLHIGICPKHELWAPFLKRLRVVVMDELHVYRGLFGAHSAGVFHRLLRLAAWAGAKPQVFALSATLGNPSETVKSLVSREPVVVTQDGSPRGSQIQFFVSPPGEDDKSPGPHVEAALLTADLIRQGERVVTFCRSRIGVELVLRDLRKRLDDPGLVEAYRGGYTPEERRAIERRMHSGELAAVVATNALELGVDIGGLDSVVMNGYPGSVTSFWQQAGRAGRAGRPGQTYLLAHEDPAEAAIAQDPLMYLGRGFDAAGPAVHNVPVAKAQLTCAAYERALRPEEVPPFGPVSEEGVGQLLDEGTLVPSAGRFFYPSHTPPANGVSLRSSAGGAVELLQAGRLIGSMEPFRALGYAHVGAVYLHRGETYRVVKLDWPNRRAELEPCPDDCYTVPVMSGVVEPGTCLDSGTLAGFEVSLWTAQVTSTAVGYRIVALPSHETVANEELQSPTLTLNTVAARWDLPAPDNLEELPIPATHTLEHGLMALAPLLTGAQASELGSAWYALSADTMRPSVWIYDMAEGGSGLAESLFRQAEAWLAGVRQLVERCNCVDGCPLCVLNSRCEVRNELISRAQLIRLIRG